MCSDIIITFRDTFDSLTHSLSAVEGADLEKEKYQYSWNDGENYSFLHSTTFEEILVRKEDIDHAEFLLEGQEVKLQKFKGKVIGADIGRSQVYEVVSINEQKTRFDSLFPVCCGFFS
jgi:elongation factor P